MKTIEVVAAIIYDDGKVLATQRGYGEFIGMWEFPGGKIKTGETPENALIREIEEELMVKIKVEDFLDVVEYDYPTFHLTMKCYMCTIETGDIVLKEHLSAKWLTKKTLDSVEWLPADIVLIDKIKNKI